MPAKPTRTTQALRWLLVAAGLAAAVLLVYAPLLLTNRVQGAGDAFTYFTPYRAFANAALRAGHLPLWNPYLFMGVPFLANPQSAVFYPLHWPWIGLDAAASLKASLALHLWLTALGSAVYVRRVARLGWAAALTAAFVWSLSGYLGARAGQINQISVAAWLPWLLTLSAFTAPRPGRRFNGVAWAVLAAALGLHLLAGHSQSSFIVLMGLLLAAIWPLLAALSSQIAARRRGNPVAFARAEAGAALQHTVLLLAAIGASAALAALQLLPTLELSALSIRSGGLSWREAVAFSLEPRGLLLTLLPSYGENLAARFATPAFGEYVGYIGVIALLLAAWGLLTARRGRLSGPRGVALAFTVIGAGLALGAYNPLYLLLVRFVPGFDLFRAPARWLMLYTFGVSVLAAYGIEALAARPMRLSWPRGQRVGWVAAALLLSALLVVQQWPGPRTWLLWLAAALVVAAAVRLPQPLALRRGLLLAALLAELALAANVLDHRHPTAPQAVAGLRNAPAVLLAARQAAEAAGHLPGRFLSLSGITYDPGDQAELEQIFAPWLSEQGFYDLLVAVKQQEIVAPNLPMLWGLPAADGYDGGVLPLRRTVDVQSLLIPPDAVAEDGRLREQLAAVPATRWLKLLGVTHVLTDKSFDVWRDNVYYDLELTTLLAPGQAVTLPTDRLTATGAGIWSYLQGAADLPDGTPVAILTLHGEGGELTERWLTGQQTAEGGWQSAVRHTQPAARMAWPRGASGWDYLTRWQWPAEFTPSHLTVRNVSEQATLALRGISLLDARIGAHAALTLPADGAFERVHSGDVKVYRTDSLPRVHLVRQVRVANDDAAALHLLAAADFDPTQQVVLLADELSAAELDATAAALVPAGAPETVRVLTDQPEQLTFAVDLAAPAVLILSDTWYPGWQVRVDETPAPLLHANYLFRAVFVPAGHHRVEFNFAPTSLQQGARISLLAGLALAGVAVWSARRRHNFAEEQTR
ncbi:MAG: hypothetical protein ABTQ73_10645 [Caldilineales bacterium]